MQGRSSGSTVVHSAATVMMVWHLSVQLHKVPQRRCVRVIIAMLAVVLLLAGSLELVLTHIGVVNLHVYNVHKEVLYAVRAHESCYPENQQARFDYFRRTLSDLKTILEKYNVRYWLDFGTLLGASRNGRFIPWDYDVDMGTTWNDIIPRLNDIIGELSASGHSMYVSSGCRLLINTRQNNTLFAMELFIYRPASAKDAVSFRRWYGEPPMTSPSPPSTVMTSSKKFAALSSPLITRCGIPDTYRYTIPSHYVNDLVDIAFEGMQLPVPRRHKEFLRKYRYPYTIGVSMPFKINCYLTEPDYMLVLLAVFGLLTAAVIGCCHASRAKRYCAVSR